MNGQWALFYFFLFTWETLLSVYLVCACVHVVFAICSYPEISLYTKILGCFQPVISLFITFLFFLSIYYSPESWPCPSIILASGFYFIFLLQWLHQTAMCACGCHLLQMKSFRPKLSRIRTTLSGMRLSTLGSREKLRYLKKKMEILQFWIAGSP